MRRSSFADMQCSVAQSLEQIGEWWTLLILRDALLGVRRFEHFQRRLGIARNVLAVRLDGLVDSGILTRRLYSQRPERYEYVLTDKGRDLWMVMNAIRQWGDRWALEDDRHPVALVHDGCGHRCTVEPHCSECGELLELADVHLEPAEGAVDPTFIAGRSARG